MATATTQARRSPWWLAALLAAAPLGCSFVVDFDEARLAPVDAMAVDPRDVTAETSLDVPEEPLFPDAPPPDRVDATVDADVREASVDVADAMDVRDAADAAVMDVRDASDVAVMDARDVADVTDANDVADAMDVRDAADVTDVAADAQPDAADGATPDASDAPEPTDAAGADVSDAPPADAPDA